MELETVGDRRWRRWRSDTGTGTEDQRRTRRARREARHRLAGPSRPAAPCRCCPGSCSRAEGGTAHARRDRHGALAAHDARGGGRRRRRGRRPRQAARRPGAAAARERGDDRVPAGGGHRADRLGLVQLPAAHVYSAEDFPRLPAVDAQLHAIDREALLETVDRVARSASRDESRPVLTGILVRFEAGQARDGRDRLVPALGQGDAARRGRAGARGDHPGPRAHGAGAARAAATTIELGVHENHVVFGTGDAWLTTRRIDGQFPNYRQLLPETSRSS